jgi:hypothetical protein
MNCGVGELRKVEVHLTTLRARTCNDPTSYRPKEYSESILCTRRRGRCKRAPIRFRSPALHAPNQVSHNLRRRRRPVKNSTRPALRRLHAMLPSSLSSERRTSQSRRRGGPSDGRRFDIDSASTNETRLNMAAASVYPAGCCCCGMRVRRLPVHRPPCPSVRPSGRSPSCAQSAASCVRPPYACVSSIRVRHVLERIVDFHIAANRLSRADDFIITIFGAVAAAPRPSRRLRRRRPFIRAPRANRGNVGINRDWRSRTLPPQLLLLMLLLRGASSVVWDAHCRRARLSGRSRAFITIEIDVAPHARNPYRRHRSPARRRMLVMCHMTGALQSTNDLVVFDTASVTQNCHCSFRRHRCASGWPTFAA